jgi:hypothetical protein
VTIAEAIDLELIDVRRVGPTCGSPHCRRGVDVFTGIVEELGEVVRLDWHGDAAVLAGAAARWWPATPSPATRSR